MGSLAVKELLLAVGGLDVLDADIETLADKTVGDELVELDADGTLLDAPDTAGATVVELVGHALVDGAVHLDVDVVADLVGAEVGGKAGKTVLAEVTSKLSTCAGTLTV